MIWLAYYIGIGGNNFGNNFLVNLYTNLINSTWVKWYEKTCKNIYKKKCK